MILKYSISYEDSINNCLFFSVYGKIRIVRDCGYIEDDKTDKECVKRSGTHDVQVHYCSCTKSLCNDGQHVRGVPQLVALFAAMLATMLVFESS